MGALEQLGIPSYVVVADWLASPDSEFKNITVIKIYNVNPTPPTYDTGICLAKGTYKDYQDWEKNLRANANRAVRLDAGLRVIEFFTRLLSQQPSSDTERLEGKIDQLINSVRSLSNKIRLDNLSDDIEEIKQAEMLEKRNGNS